MRIIAGTFRSRQLKSLKGLALRPTSDRLREALFNVLAERIPGCRFLDVFAGTGAVGIEAFSRGAAEAVFIENHPPAATLIQKNLDSLGIQGSTRVLKLDALRGLQRIATERTPASAPFDIVFLDPPYADADEYRRVLTFLGSAPFLAPGGLVIAEHRRTFDLPEALGQLERVRVLRQGDASLSFFRVQLAVNPNAPAVHLSS
ncbi:MAG TPA: 16S rRNA (guanine(966)-N(2))-methyltransferase RsmD [Verrucomicrobiae bacterium]|nr:16S rRNA (guanine(966)-N(2))-methyltransferase RsmD [Verrucomicrobiae bacterium]